jgi:predicted Zn finger-like uncharacterized protein
MILVCENCSTSLQLDEKKAPSGKFTIRCPKCKSLVSVSVPVGNQNSSPNGASEAAANNNSAQPAARYKPPQTAGNNSESPAAGASEELMRLLAGLLNQKGGGNFDNSASEPETSVLLCLAPEQREKAAQLLSENGWQPFIAENTSQALETLSEIKIGNVVLASNFAPEQRGSQMLQNHFFNLSPAVRRNIFLVYLDDRPQSAGSTHESFLRNLNFIVNVRDLPNLPQILRRERRDFDAAYRFYKSALTDA